MSTKPFKAPFRFPGSLRILISGVGAALIALLITGCSEQKADLVFHGAAIYRVDDNRSWAEALAVKDGKIVFVGKDSEVQAWIGSGTETIDLQGKMVLPGFVDAHMHPKMGGAHLRHLDLSATQTKEDILEKVKIYADEHPDKKVIIGVNFPLVAFPDANPRKEDLDIIVPDRPVILTEADAHSAWLNSKALEIAAITKDSRDPEGGKIERDPLTGNPSGTLREPWQFEGVEKLKEGGLLAPYFDVYRGIKKANEVGITSLLDALVVSKDQWVYRILKYFGFLNARVNLALWVDPKAGISQLDDLASSYHDDPEFRLRTTTAKFILDGVLTSKTGLLVDPYHSDPESKGLSVFDPDILSRLAVHLDKHKFQLHLHGVGDGAVRLALDTIKSTQQENGVRDARHHIAHADVIHPDDLLRFRKLNAIANIQPYWGYYSGYVKASENVLGEERKNWIYTYASILRNQARIAAGSDWPVSTLNPLDAIQVAITRKSLGKEKDAIAFLPEEALDLETMIAAYTIYGAYALKQEHATGSIEVGKFADLIVLDKNLFEIPVNEIHKTKVLLTFLAGEKVFEANSLL